MQKLCFSLFTLNLFLKKNHLNASCTSNWQTHLPCLHQETLRVLNSLSDKYENSNNINNRHADATSGNRDSYVRKLSLVERVLSHFLLDPGPMNVTINRLKK